MMVQVESENEEFVKDALDKATKKKRYYTGNLTHRAMHCPVCDSIVFRSDNYCKFCGQKFEKEEY